VDTSDSQREKSKHFQQGYFQLWIWCHENCLEEGKCEEKALPTHPPWLLELTLDLSPLMDICLGVRATISDRRALCLVSISGLLLVNITVYTHLRWVSWRCVRSTS
jgi:hypothetical protein